MKTNKGNNADVKTLVRLCMKIEPAAFAALGAKSGAGGNVKAGLNEFIRLVLDQAIKLLWAPKGHQVRLQTATGAREMGYDAQLFNLLQLCSFALVRSPRRKRGLGDLVLREADAKITNMPRKPDAQPRLPMAELILTAGSLFEPDFDAIRDAPSLGAPSCSIQAPMASLLNVDPKTLISLYYEDQRDATEAYARDPEGQALAGLAAMLTRVLHRYFLIVEQEIDSIRLWVATDAAYSGMDGAAATNLSALLTYALLHDGKRDLGFVA